MRETLGECFDEDQQLWPCMTAIRCLKDQSLFAVSVGQGIFRRTIEAGRWERAHKGLPNDTVVNRLQLIENRLFVCTNKGLFYWQEIQWVATDLTIPCYQIIKVDGGYAVASMYGVWCGNGTTWLNMASPDTQVLDLLSSPHFLFLATNQGISMYDRLTYEWAHFPLSSGVTSLANYQGKLMGISEKGGLVVGNQQGGFTITYFPDFFLFSLMPHERAVYVCSDRGLYQLASLGGNMILRSVQCGTAVVDIDVTGDYIYMATLFKGVQTVERSN
ncbi:hypothetical protein D3C73_611240 [compost metagenome]